jgi:3-dehydrosphinganine reductase
VFEEAEVRNGPIDVLVNNAGFVAQGGFDELDPSVFESQLRINYLSAVYATRAVIDGMKRRGAGHVAFVSSAAGQCAIWGYSAYSPSKFALRGFAETMHMELLPHNIGVSILYPPNTATEGYQEEMKGMPPEVKEIGGSAGLFTPGEVAQRFIDDLCKGEFATTIGLEGWMLGVVSAGTAPEPNAFNAIAQTLTTGLLRAVMLFYLGGFNRIVHKFHKQRKRGVVVK